MSNQGRCVDIFAPGDNVMAAQTGHSMNSNRGYTLNTGTSMAAPHVVGLVALYLEDHPTATPQEVERVMKAAAGKNKLYGVGNNTNNFLLNSAFVVEPIRSLSVPIQQLCCYQNRSLSPL
ncbi:MAG: S8 family serine peptidase [Deinococcales bacterium]